MVWLFWLLVIGVLYLLARRLWRKVRPAFESPWDEIEEQEERREFQFVAPDDNDDMN